MYIRLGIKETLSKCKYYKMFYLILFHKKAPSAEINSNQTFAKSYLARWLCLVFAKIRRFFSAKCKLINRDWLKLKSKPTFAF